MIYSFTGMETNEQTISNGGSRKNGQNNHLKNQRISDSQDPFIVMYKHIIDPILSLDKLEVLREDKVQFEVMIYPKDLKNFSKKEELVKQRVHIESSQSANSQNLQAEVSEPSDQWVIELNLDKEFERHSKERDRSDDMMEDMLQPASTTENNINEQHDPEKLQEEQEGDSQDEGQHDSGENNQLNNDEE